ncbi:E3 SUMO-protein ligase RanBP2 [Chionoecetes opilio]|uniref:E3 SUMO-protein ligase RanBP2 n=1 Tax=Chionoecetes opilio TaxID=41210 RepID=A0A8J4XZW9_CHIOP|nr:E3 SUMO-protein ligase RanBP2 [Chionoecetes opilio]
MAKTRHDVVVKKVGCLDKSDVWRSNVGNLAVHTHHTHTTDIRSPVTHTVVGVLCCASLGDLVWLCLQQAPPDLRQPQPYYAFSLFDGLQFSSARMDGWNPETLCHLDLLAYLAATVYCQQVAAKKTTHSLSAPPPGPPPATLPTILSPALCTPEQGECWGAAHTLFTNRAHHNLGKLRMTLQRGLEVIRAHGNHGINLPLMAHLAQCFTQWVGH